MYTVQESGTIGTGFKPARVQIFSLSNSSSSSSPSSPALLLFLVVEDTLFPRKLVEDRILPC